MRGTLVYRAIEKSDQALQKIIRSTDYPVNWYVYAGACVVVLESISKFIS